MLDELRARVGWTALRAYRRLGGGERAEAALQSVQATRERVEEIEGALLHFWLLPSRADLRTLRRRVHRLRREVRALEGELARVERLLEERS
ncbi:MAG: hypothetical protein AAFU79_35385 [Myxococcota bacterium]